MSEGPFQDDGQSPPTCAHGRFLPDAPCPWCERLKATIVDVVPRCETHGQILMHGCPWCSMESGAAAERARIVAWLFHRAGMRDPAHPKESLVSSTLYEALAKQIQAGAHEEDHCGNATERGEHEDK